MTSETQSSAIRAYEIMKGKGYEPEEIQTFLDYLDQRVLDVTKPITDRLDQVAGQVAEERRIARRHHKVAFWVYLVSMGLILSLPDQALLVGLKIMYSLIP